MRFKAAAFVLIVMLGAPSLAHAQTPRVLYSRALGQERVLRLDMPKATLRQLRAGIAQYETLVRKYPGSGYSDNALWQAANLALLSYERFGQPADKRTATRLFEQLIQQYPTSSLVQRARQALGQQEQPTTGVATVPAAPPAPVAPLPTTTAAADSKPAASTGVTIRDIKRSSLPDGVRITVEMDGEAPFRSERLENPRRVFFDISSARTTPGLQDAAVKLQDDVVRHIRFGRHPNATRIVMDLEGADSYSVFTLYDPYRLVIDFKRTAAATTPPPAAVKPAFDPAQTGVRPAFDSGQTGARPMPESGRSGVEAGSESSRSAVGAESKVRTEPIAGTELKPLPSRPISTASTPELPAVNRDGTFSLARQLGLGISRIVIDAGHGGHDPGAMANGLTEAELTLDVATRLARLLQKQPGVEVVMTRSTDVFIPLEERTAIANREGADLFLSIHANASRSAKARGVETYVLNFASNPEAEAIAARENSGSAQTMGRLPDIVKAIALHNKLDESRDFAAIVQRAMVRRLSARNKNLRDLGVKQAPFVVLIGAAMPSVLAEISFVTNKQEGALLKTNTYRQQIAEALLDAVLRYQQSLKKTRSASTTTLAR
jgi:N-acetylmuramoyl-L-alanine amidase